MLKSLFGDLSSLPPRKDTPDSVLQVARLHPLFRRRDDNADASLAERVEQDVFVSGSPAQAMRAHLAAMAPIDGHQVVTLMDSGHRLAPRLIRSLSAATGEPVQRLNIRDHASQHPMVILERTVVPRGSEPALKLYHVEVPPWQGDRAPVDDSASTPYVLMEASSMAAVVMSRMTAAEADDALAKLALASQAPSWRCPTLIFVLTHDTAWVAERIQNAHWPADMRVDIVLESSLPSVAPREALTAAAETEASPAAVWNALLSAWDRQDGANLPPAHIDQALAAERSRAIGRTLRNLMMTEGIVGCAVADMQSGTLVAGESHDADVDLTQACAALAPLMRAQQDACRLLDGGAPLEEMFLSAGEVQFVVRPLTASGVLYLIARVNRAQSNLTLVRLKLAEAQAALR